MGDDGKTEAAYASIGYDCGLRYSQAGVSCGPLVVKERYALPDGQAATDCELRDRALAALERSLEASLAAVRAARKDG